MTKRANWPAFFVVCVDARTALGYPAHISFFAPRQGGPLIQIILLVLGIIAAVRFPRLLRARASDYPNVDPAAFRVWYSKEKAAAIWLIVATIGVVIVQFFAGLVLGIALGASGTIRADADAYLGAFSIASVALFLILIVVAAMCGSQAKKLKVAAGITWPKKSESVPPNEKRPSTGPGVS